MKSSQRSVTVHARPSAIPSAESVAARVRWRDRLIAIGLGAAIVIIQLVFFNDPTGVVAVR